MVPSVLIVDDEKHTRDGLQQALADNYDVSTAASADEAFNLLAAQDYDIVLTDLRMPGETINDELQLLARVILEEHRRRLPFLGKLLVESLNNPNVGALFYKTFIVQGRLLFTQFLKSRQEVGDVRDVLDTEVAAAIRAAATESPDVLLIVAPQSEAAMREAARSSSTTTCRALGKTGGGGVGVPSAANGRTTEVAPVRSSVT